MIDGRGFCLQSDEVLKEFKVCLNSRLWGHLLLRKEFLVAVFYQHMLSCEVYFFFFCICGANATVTAVQSSLGDAGLML